MNEEEKKIAVIKNTLTGEARERALAELITDKHQQSIENLKIDLKYNHIDRFVYDTKMAELTYTDKELLEEMLLNIELDHDKITTNEYERRLADINAEPYVRVINIEYDEKNPSAGFFELDYNEHFVEYLANNGYGGTEPDDIVDNWFNDICKNIVLADLEDADGTAKSFLSDSKEGKLIQRTRVDGNFSEYT